jgi:hypothetical protein
VASERQRHFRATLLPRFGIFLESPHTIYSLVAKNRYKVMLAGHTSGRLQREGAIMATKSTKSKSTKKAPAKKAGAKKSTAKKK